MTDFVEQDTKALQLASLDAFAAVLGYIRLPCGSSSYHAVNDHGVNMGFKGCPTLHFGTMVMLHNSNWEHNQYRSGYYHPAKHPIEKVYSWDNILFTLDAYTLGKAIGCTIVDKVYLQSKESGDITCHKNLVKFVDPAYHYLFLKGE